MQVRFTIRLTIKIDRQIEINHYRHLLYVDTLKIPHMQRIITQHQTSLPLDKTLVVINTFSCPFLNLSNTAIRCSTVRSPVKTATAWPSLLIFSANQLAVLRVCIKGSLK